MVKKMDESIKNILDIFSQEHLREYPRDVLDLALERETELTPYLLRILEDVLADPEAHAESQWSYGPIFAMQLLAHFENHDAHETIDTVMSLPREVLDPIYGDMITEDFSRVLYQTCGGRNDKIKGLVLNSAADDYARGSAMKALVLGVQFGDLPRRETMDFFEQCGGDGVLDAFHSRTPGHGRRAIRLDARTVVGQRLLPSRPRPSSCPRRRPRGDRSPYPSLLFSWRVRWFSWLL